MGGEIRKKGGGSWGERGNKERKGENTHTHTHLQGEDTTLGLGLITDVRILLAHTDHHTLVAGAADNGGKDSAGCIITGKAGLAHTRAVINHKGSDVVRHFEGECVRTKENLANEHTRRNVGRKYTLGVLVLSYFGR